MGIVYSLYIKISEYANPPPEQEDDSLATIVKFLNVDRFLGLFLPYLVHLFLLSFLILIVSVIHTSSKTSSFMSSWFFSQKSTPVPEEKEESTKKEKENEKEKKIEEKPNRVADNQSVFRTNSWMMRAKAAQNSPSISSDRSILTENSIYNTHYKDGSNTSISGRYGIGPKNKKSVSKIKSSDNEKDGKENDEALNQEEDGLEQEEVGVPMMSTAPSTVIINPSKYQISPDFLADTQPIKYMNVAKILEESKAYTSSPYRKDYSYLNPLHTMFYKDYDPLRRLSYSKPSLANLGSSTTLNRTTNPMLRSLNKNFSRSNQKSSKLLSKKVKRQLSPNNQILISSFRKERSNSCSSNQRSIPSYREERSNSCSSNQRSSPSYKKERSNFRSSNQISIPSFSKGRSSYNSGNQRLIPSFKKESPNFSSSNKRSIACIQKERMNLYPIKKKLSSKKSIFCCNDESSKPNTYKESSNFNSSKESSPNLNKQRSNSYSIREKSSSPNRHSRLSRLLNVSRIRAKSLHVSRNQVTKENMIISPQRVCNDPYMTNISRYYNKTTLSISSLSETSFDI